MALDFTSPDTNLLDPLQGYDIKVTIQNEENDTQKLAGAFTSLMFKIVNQTETYLTLNNRIPRHLDGEIIIVWSMEQGLIDLDVMGNTFGAEFATGLKSARGPANIPRQTRFKILFQTNIADLNGSSANLIDSAKDTTFRQNKTNLGTNGKTLYALHFCRVDTMTFGVAAGRHIVANTWQGTAQTLGPITGN